MRYQQDLQVRLRDRLRRLTVVDVTEADHEVRLVVDWIEGQPALRAILAEADQVEPDLDFDAWEATLRDWGSFGVNWPSRSEDGRASLAWRLLKLIAEEKGSVQTYGYALTREREYRAHVRGFAERIVTPLFDYLSERIGAESTVLYVLERYVRHVEWFERDVLHEKYLQNTQQGEVVYDKDLREFLFSEGINMPFSQAKSPSGESDVLSELDSDDPLVCEVKLYDGTSSHRKSNVGAGVNQVLHYAHDYKKTTAYLVIINLSGNALELPSDGPTGIWPPYVEVEGVHIHLIGVRALPPVASASKLGKARPVHFTRDDLIHPDTTEEA